MHLHISLTLHWLCSSLSVKFHFTLHANGCVSNNYGHCSIKIRSAVAQLCLLHNSPATYDMCYINMWRHTHTTAKSIKRLYQWLGLCQFFLHLKLIIRFSKIFQCCYQLKKNENQWKLRNNIIKLNTFYGYSKFSICFQYLSADIACMKMIILGLQGGKSILNEFTITVLEPKLIFMAK